MATDAERELAYAAGRAAFSEPPERRSIDACPFEVGTEERAEWIAGFGSALDEFDDVTELRRAVNEARND